MESKAQKHNALYLGLGKRIADIRKLNRMTQRELSELTGISLSYLGQLEKGKRAASVGMVSDIAGSLNCPLSALFTNEVSTNEEVEENRQMSAQQLLSAQELSNRPMTLLEKKCILNLLFRLPLVKFGHLSRFLYRMAEMLESRTDDIDSQNFYSYMFFSDHDIDYYVECLMEEFEDLKNVRYEPSKCWRDAYIRQCRKNADYYRAVDQLIEACQDYRF